MRKKEKDKILKTSRISVAIRPNDLETCHTLARKDGCRTLSEWIYLLIGKRATDMGEKIIEKTS